MKKQMKTIKEKKVDRGITLDTVLFKDMVARARKGASNNSIIPLTSMMAIELQDNKLTLITTDSKNYLYIIQDNIPGNDFYAVVIVDTFANLIAKTTSDTIHLELKDNALEVIGNGKYLIELPDEEGEMIQFPDPREDEELDILDDIKLTTINSILTTAKPSLSTTMEEPCNTDYYCGKKIYATDRYKICIMNVKLWDEPRLIPPQVMDLLSIMTAEDIAVEAGDDVLIFSTPDCVLYARTMDGIEDFNVEGIQKFVDEAEYNSVCKIRKSSIMQLLDRLSLFVSDVDQNEIYLTFTSKGLQVSSKQSSGTELIKYLESDDFEDFTCVIDIGTLSDQVKALQDDTVEIHYGDEAGIMFVEGNTKLITALSTDDRLEDDEDEDEE